MTVTASSGAPGGTAERSGRYLRDLLGKEFTEAQLDVVRSPLRPQLVIAGAGSGKTSVVAARVVHAVAHHGVAPARVLGLTFTNKAAGELSERVRSSVAKLSTTARSPTGGPGGPAGLDTPDGLDELPTVSTYHAYAAQIVRDHALRIGREPTATLLTDASQWQLAMRVVRRAEGPFPHLAWTTSYVARLVMALAGELSDHLVDPADVLAHDERVIAAVESLSKPVADARKLLDRARGRAELLTLVADYQAEKERLDVLDFGDQVALAARIAEVSPEVGALERARYDLVVLDEYQDTGVAQRVLLTRLFGAGHAVTAVGDPNQAIYGWRGASVGNLLRFGEHFCDAEAAVAAQPLMTSFRCGGRILDAANAVVAPLGSSLAATRRPTVDVPPLSAVTGAEADGEVCVSRLSTAVEEADWLADQVARELAASTPAGEIAILARRRADFPRLHHALLARDIPVEVVGLGGLLEMPEVADVVALLSVLVDATANAAVVRLLTGPRWRIGVRDLAALGRRAAHLATWSPPVDGEEPAVGGRLDSALRQATDAVDPVEVPSLLDALESPGDPSTYSEAALRRFREFDHEVRRLRGLVGQPLVDVLVEVVESTGLDVEIESSLPKVAAARSANLAAFIDVAAQFVGLDGESDLGAFLAYLSAAADNEDGLDVGAVSDADTVKLMTIHKAKGLEWDVVAVPGLVDKVFPSERGRSSWVTGAHVLPFAIRGDTADLPVLGGYGTAELAAFKADCASDVQDEERRLAYVAFTRARRRLLLSAYCWSPTRQAPCDVSAYLTEVVALGEPSVVVDHWCEDPVEPTNPLLAAAAVDVPWPAAPDPAELRRRQEAAGLVRSISSRRADAGEGIRLSAHHRTVEQWDREAQLLLDELRRSRQLTRDVPLPARLTASQVVALAHDPVSFARSLARPVPIRPQPQARRGSRFHAWVERRHGGGALLEADDLPGSSDPDLDDAELSELQRRFLESPWGDRRPVAVETPFELVVGGRLLRGRIDAVYRDNAGGYDVIDYKTGAVLSDLAAASLQLSVYRLAWADLAHVDPAAVNAGFLYIRSGELKRPDRLLSRDELAALLTG